MAWSIGKVARKQPDATDFKNKQMANVSPYNYNPTFANKSNPVKWSLSGRYETVDKRVIVSPQKYDLPSKMIESRGKTMGIKLNTARTSKDAVPGPATYTGEKIKYEDYRFSMAGRLDRDMSKTF